VVVAPRTRRRASMRLLFSDFIGLAMAATIGPFVVYALSSNPHEKLGPIYAFNFAVIPLFIALFLIYGLYQGVTRRISTNVFFDLPNIMHAILIAGLLYTLEIYIAGRGLNFRDVSMDQALSICVCALVFVPLARLSIFSSIGRHNLARTISVIVVGTGKVAQTTASHLKANSRVNFVGFVDDKPLEQSQVIGNLEDLPNLCQVHDVSRVVVCFSRTHPERLTDILKRVSGQVGVSVVPRYYELITPRSHIEDLSGLTMLDIPSASMSAGARLLKRSFDVVVSSLVLAAISPLIAVVGIMVKLTSSGPVFFNQVRVGQNEETFSMLKFRTMNRDAESTRHELAHLNESDGPLFKIRNDPRVTRLGRLLRRTSLDEMPQLINVWRGDMSLVGPRPFIVSESMMIEGWARKRFEARPGMTGLWQVSGRNELSHLEMARLDYLYVASWSFWLDIYILWQTPIAMFRGRGAS